MEALQEVDWYRTEYPAKHLQVGEVPEDPGEGYALVKDLLYHQVHKFHRLYGGEFEELVGEAHLAFMGGHTQFVRGTRKNGAAIDHTYCIEIRRWVWFNLFDAMRKRADRERIAPTHRIGEDQEFPAVLPTFNLNLWAQGLNRDAREVVVLVLDPPEAVVEVAEGKGGQPRNYRSTVRDYLQQELGWTAARVVAAFAEIKGALDAS